VSDDPGTNGGRPPRIAVALSIADEELRRRALHAVEGCSRRLALVADLESADVVITDHDAELDVTAIFVGDKQAIADAMRRASAGVMKMARSCVESSPRRVSSSADAGSGRRAPGATGCRMGAASAAGRAVRAAGA